MSGTTKAIKCPACGALAGKSCRSLRSGKPLSDNHATRRLISINEAARAGHVRLRKPIWANPFDHIKIDLFDGRMGPWIHLYAPFNKQCNGRDPVDIIAISQQASFATPELEIYDGPLPNSDEYRAEVERFDAPPYAMTPLPAAGGLPPTQDRDD